MDMTRQGGFWSTTQNGQSASRILLVLKSHCLNLAKGLLPGIIVMLAACSGGNTDSVSGTFASTLCSTQLPGVSKPVAFQDLGLQIISDNEWDVAAVHQVLDTFAYGGQATDAQISKWADMQPDEAIVEMLTFDQHNLLLSHPVDSDTDQLYLCNGTLHGLGELWSTDYIQNSMPDSMRYKYDPETGVSEIWLYAAILRGLNPFRQKIGLWETNYHLATNLDNNVWPNMMIRYYDDIMEAHAANLPYQDILSIASTSAAVTRQYGHWANKIVNGECLCNEDFAREYYQLFYGILGDGDESYHETVTIKNTALALTGIALEHLGNGGLGDNIIFSADEHYKGLLEMMHALYAGQTSDERIDRMSQDAINHVESLNNLPVMIINGLADDKLDDLKKSALRGAWANMQTKSLLTFIRAYAVSTLFHSSDRVKYLTSVDRHLKIANSMNLNNKEVYLNLYGIGNVRFEGVDMFHPVHNNFGGQTGIEAYNSARAFRINYNRVTETGALFRDTEGVMFGQSWKKDWGSVIPVNSAGDYKVKAVAEWLWERFIGDNLRNFGALERAHVYTLLATGSDLVNLVSPGQLDRVITTQDVQTDADIVTQFESLVDMDIMLDSDDTNEFKIANERVGLAIEFIIGSPYMFIHEGGKV